jgi:hypothetical protein
MREEKPFTPLDTDHEFIRDAEIVMIGILINVRESHERAASCFCDAWSSHHRLN